MCPVCLASLAVTVATTTGVGATAVAVATRVAKSLVPPRTTHGAVPEERTEDDVTARR
jgi:hypothetical protein